MQKISGKIAIVTGGTKGIGFAIAGGLLDEGARVYICGRDRTQLDNALKELDGNGEIAGSVCNLTSEDDVRRLIADCVARYGGLDILVNNAGIGIFGKTVEELSPEEFRSVIETNLFGVFYACHFAIPELKKQGGGYIINISSLAGQNAHPKMAAYNASKFGLNGFSESLMQEVRQDDIKVSYISPGSVNTEFGGDSIKTENAWQIQPVDITQIVIGLLNCDPRCLPSKVEVRPSKPPLK